MTGNQFINELNRAILVRESGDLGSSRKLFHSLIKKINVLASSTVIENQNLYLKVMGEYVIQFRHEGKKALQKGLQLATDLYAYNRDHKLANPGAVRGVSNTLMNLEGYEQAEIYLREMLCLIPDTESAKKGDTLAHLSRCLFRQGKVDRAEGLIDEALALINQNTEKAPEINIAVWKSHALMVKSLLENNHGNVTFAVSLAGEAAALADKYQLPLRLGEARELLHYLQESQ